MTFIAGLAIGFVLGVFCLIAFVFLMVDWDFGGS